MYDLSTYNAWAPDQGMSGFGGKDWDYAKGLGLNDQQMYILGSMQARAGRTLGKRVQDNLNRLRDVNPWDYGADGGWGFGGSDIKRAIGQGATYNDIQGYVDHANQYGINVGGKATDWLSQNKDNIAFYDANQRRDLQISDQKAAEARAQAQWEENVVKQKEMNPKTSAQNAMMKSGSAGGVAVKRSDDFKAGSGVGSSTQANRQMFIDALNI